MAKPEAGPIRPVVEWKLTGRDGAPRTFEQSELSIEGEARLLGMARQAGTILKEHEFNLDSLTEMAQTGTPQWEVIEQAISLIVENVPKLVAETVAILLGIFPTDEDGRPNPTYEDDVKFFRQSVNSAKVHDMFRVFIDQNEWQRIAGPLWTRFFGAAEPDRPPLTSDGSGSTD